MYLPRALLSKLYLHLQATRRPLSPPVLLLVALEPDALCACRILCRLLRHDYIPHKIQPVSGYADLQRVGRTLVAPMMETRGGSGGVVVCLGVGGMVDLAAMLGLESDEESSDAALSYGGVEVWVLDSRRPWNLSNIFGGAPLRPAAEVDAASASSYQARCPDGVVAGRIEHTYRPGGGGIIVFDDGDIEEDLGAEREAYMALLDMPEVDDDGRDLSETEDESEDDEDGDGDEDARDDGVEPRAGQKRKSWSDQYGSDDDDDDDRPRQRRRSNSSNPIPERRPGLIHLQQRNNAVLSSDPADPPTAAQPPKQPSARTLRRRLLRLKREKERVLQEYYHNGSSYSEPISAMLYSLASDLGREDNDLLWLTIVGVTSMELYGRSSAGVGVSVRDSSTKTPLTGWMGVRGARIRQLLRDEVRRLNPPPDLRGGGVNAAALPEASGLIPTTALSPEDTSIRLSPEPKFLLIRHWSLYDSMLHSPYLFSRLRIWNEGGLKRLHKLLAKMGVSLVQCRQSYAHMDMVLKRELRAKLLKYASLYNLDDMVPGADSDGKDRAGAKDGWGFVRSWGWRATLSAQDVAVVVGAMLEVGKNCVVEGDDGSNSQGQHHRPRQPQTSQSSLDLLQAEDVADAESQEWITRFWDAYDALEDIDSLKAGLPTAQHLHRAIRRTGTSLLGKRQIRHLRAFRLCVVRDGGPDSGLFTHPGALTKLALWIGEALAQQEREERGRLSNGGRGTPLVVASLCERRGVYVVVGTGGGGGGGGFGVGGWAEGAELVRRRKEEREKKAKAKEESRAARRKVREEKRAARKAAAEARGKDDDEDEEDDTESEGSDDGTDSSDSESDTEELMARRGKGWGVNRFGTAFQEVVEETNARVRIDSFEHCVVEVKKEDLGGFLEALSMKAVVG